MSHVALPGTRMHEAAIKSIINNGQNSLSQCTKGRLQLSGNHYAETRHHISDTQVLAGSFISLSS